MAAPGHASVRSRSHQVPPVAGDVEEDGDPAVRLGSRRADEHQARAVGDQTAGRVGFFLHVDDFAEAHARMLSAGVTFVTEPRTEPYGQVAVFLDVAGNRWDLLGPAPTQQPRTSRSRSA